jgi:hypothetical protein
VVDELNHRSLVRTCNGAEGVLKGTDMGRERLGGLHGLRFTASGKRFNWCSEES